MMTNQTTADDSFWVRVFQLMHPGMLAMGLISGAPLHRTVAVLLAARRPAPTNEPVR
jgi:hypothetical protein